MVPKKDKEEMVFSLIFKKPESQFKQLKLETTTISNFIILFDFVVTDSSAQ
jgi:hypothetical protein